MHKFVKKINAGRIGLVTAVTMLAAMALASMAQATTIDIKPATEKVETEFSTALPIILVVVGLVVAATLVIVFFRKHAKKG
jgi:heme/copper-type cytochrome/quinol oxidase subunit 2